MLGKLKKRKRLRTHGYLERSSTFNGLKVLKDRRRK
jgi:ribosomal protein L34